MNITVYIDIRSSAVMICIPPPIAYTYVHRTLPLYESRKRKKEKIYVHIIALNSSSVIDLKIFTQ